MHQVLRTLIRHNSWATLKLLESCSELTAAEWNREFAIGPGSLRKTMTHIVGCMVRWSDRIAERPLRPSIEDDGVERSPGELMTLLDACTHDLEQIAEQIDRRDAMDEVIPFAMPEGKVYRFSKAAALAHVLTHGMHHRAQALNMRRQLGLGPLGLDLDAVEWEAVQTGQLQV